jgi:double stranded RNA-specific editase B
LKDGVEFHLFVTTAPCGDARIFSLHESSSSSSLASESSRERDAVDCYRPDSSRGLLRSKIECGMGTVPISSKITVQTFDGVMSGDRLLTMACSDKILRWNVVGLQGALLSLLIKPVYLKSITVGSKFHPGNFRFF